jgi:hypothetical protein
MVNLLWHAHLARDFTGGTPVPLFHFVERFDDWFDHDWILDIGRRG